MNKRIRSDFPVLSRKINGKPIIYFDSACMSLRPKQVIEAISEYYTDYPACAGRSNHKLAEEVTQKTEEARKMVAKFINAKNDREIIFTRNTSEGLNLLAYTLDLKSEDVVLTTDKEHNSNLVPWQVLQKKKGIIHKVIPSKKNNTFDMDEYKRLLNEKVKVVSVVHTSNLDGVTNPVNEIVELAHKYGAICIIDGAQGAPHQAIDVQKLDVDFLAFSAHKMAGPSGMGVLYGKEELLEKLPGFMVGGDTVNWTTYIDHDLLPIPEKFEAGLQNYAGMIGVGAATDYLTEVGLKRIKEHEIELNKTFQKGIEDIEGLSIIGPDDPLIRGGVTTFYIEDIDPHELSLMLSNSYNIMMRSGQHCVHSWFNDREIKNSIRASFYLYNDIDEVEKAIESIKLCVDVLR
jgi:cysteine desulfurase/selenocysteine lyase